MQTAAMAAATSASSDSSAPGSAGAHSTSACAMGAAAAAAIAAVDSGVERWDPATASAYALLAGRTIPKALSCGSRSSSLAAAAPTAVAPALGGSATHSGTAGSAPLPADAFAFYVALHQGSVRRWCQAWQQHMAATALPPVAAGVARLDPSCSVPGALSLPRGSAGVQPQAPGAPLPTPPGAATAAAASAGPPHDISRPHSSPTVPGSGELPSDSPPLDAVACAELARLHLAALSALLCRYGAAFAGGGGIGVAEAHTHTAAAAAAN